MKISQLNEQHVLVELNLTASITTTKKLLAIQQYFIDNKTINLIDATLGFNHLLLALNGEIDLAQIKAHCQAAINHPTTVTQSTQHCFPVCYELGDDIDFLQQQTGLSLAELIHLHARQWFRVYSVGFLPGFAYLGDLPKRIQCERKSTPRISVPVGAVAIAEQFTAIYPQASPGGWHIIGRCPTPPNGFNNPLKPFDEVMFVPISSAEYQDKLAHTSI